MDTWLAVASRREVREYADRDLPEDVVRRILDAGRLAGSAKNRQAWRFLVVESPEVREQLAAAVYEPANVRGAKLVVAILAKGSLDTGRAMQNMLLVAWNEGLGSCPNGIADLALARKTLGLGEDDELAIVLTFGYPAREPDPSRHSPEEWSGRANRKPRGERGGRRENQQSHDQLTQVGDRAHARGRGRGRGQPAGPVDHRTPVAVVDHPQHREEVARRAHRRAEDGLPAQVDRADVHRHLRPTRAAVHDQPPAGPQRPRRVAPGRADRVEHDVDGADRLRPALVRVEDATCSAELLRPLELRLARRGDEHARALLGRQLHREGRDAAAGAEDEHGLVGLEPTDREQRPVRGQGRERERGGLLPRQARGLPVHVCLGQLDELGVGAVRRTAEDSPVRSRRILPLTPVEARVDHDLLPGVSADPRAVRAGDDRLRELVGRPGRVAEQQVAAVDRRRLQLHDHLPRARDRIREVLVGEPAALGDDYGLHRVEAQGSSAETSTATYPPSPIAGARTTASWAGSSESLYEPCTTSLSM